MVGPKTPNFSCRMAFASISTKAERELPANWDPTLPVFPADAKGLATRDSSGKVLNAINSELYWFAAPRAGIFIKRSKDMVRVLWR